MKKLLGFAISLVLLLMTISASAEQLTLSDYTVTDITQALFESCSLDELIEIKKALDEEITARQKQWALEHANRQVTFEQSEIILFKGKSMKVSPIVTRVTDDAPERTNFVWSTDNADVARYNGESGIVAVGKGTTTIRCVAKDDEAVIGEITVTVALPVNEVKIAGATDKLLLGAAPEKSCIDLQATILPEDAYVKGVTWTSSNDAVATVDENGHVQAIQPGNVTITATSLDDSSYSRKKASYRLTITQAVTGIELSESNVTVGAGRSVNVKATVSPANATNKRIVWSTSDKNIAIYSEGRIVAKNPGTCTITATADDGSGVTASCNVTVVRLITGISFKETTLAMNAGEKKELTVQIQPTDATNKRVTWESSDTSVATVSSSGMVTAKKAGNCTISATTTDGTAKKATVRLNVAPSVQELLNGGTWYYNGGSNTAVNSITFTKSTATVKMYTFDGNGRHDGGKTSGEYTVSSTEVTVTLTGGKKLRIPYTVKNGALSLGKGTYFTLAEVEAGLQGYWRLRYAEKSIWGGMGEYEYNVYINRGKFTYENACNDATGRYEYWYYGPYYGNYKLTFSGFGMEDNSSFIAFFWNIIDGKPTLLRYDHVFTKKNANGLPGQNGYHF